MDGIPAEWSPMSVVKHAFAGFGLARTYLHVLENSGVAIRIYEQCGFIMDDRLRQHGWKAGVFVVVMGLCRA
jgi:RimJ/RimL family protein N-acetyltransferase